MEPGAYNSFTRFQANQPSLVPADQEDMPDAHLTAPLSIDWTVYTPNVVRGSLKREAENPNDPRMSVGWKADATSSQRLKDAARTSTQDQQSFMWSGGYVSKDNETPPQSSAATLSYPHPNLSLPHPSLNLDFRMSVTLNPRISLGSVPFGHRNWISFTGGSWSGSWGSGIVLPGGQDSQIIIPNGSAFLDTNYLLQTHDDHPAHILIKTRGWRTGPPEILARLADPELADTVDPRDYKFRIFIEMETGDERYKDKVNCGMWVGSGMRMGAEVVYDAYRVS